MSLSGGCRLSGRPIVYQDATWVIRHCRTTFMSESRASFIDCLISQLTQRDHNLIRSFTFEITHYVIINRIDSFRIVMTKIYEHQHRFSTIINAAVPREFLSIFWLSLLCFSFFLRIEQSIAQFCFSSKSVVCHSCS